jgi:hypothetical protein
MRVALILGVLLILAMNVAAVAPATEPLRPYLTDATLALSVLVLIGLLLPARQKPPPSKPQAEPAKVAPPAPAAARADAEIVSFLAMLQEKGRLVDFLMDDINPYNDAQVGPPPASCTPDARESCWSISAFTRCAPRMRDRPCRSPPDRTSTGWSARSPARRRSRACLSTVAGRLIW